MNVELTHDASRTTASLLRYMLTILPHEMGRRVTGGLPAGSISLDKAGLILGGTPCTVPLFRDAMLRAGRELEQDVLIARHGNRPEVLDPVLFDALIWSSGHPIMLTDLLLFAGPDDHWLVPSKQGAYIRLAADGLYIEAEPGFITWHQRCEGVCRASREIIQATYGTEVLGW